MNRCNNQQFKLFGIHTFNDKFNFILGQKFSHLTF